MPNVDFNPPIPIQPLGAPAYDPSPFRTAVLNARQLRKMLPELYPPQITQDADEGGAEASDTVATAAAGNGDNAAAGAGGGGGESGAAGGGEVVGIGAAPMLRYHFIPLNRAGIDTAAIPGPVTEEEESELLREAQSFGVEDALTVMRQTKQRIMGSAADVAADATTDAPKGAPTDAPTGAAAITNVVADAGASDGAGADGGGGGGGDGGGGAGGSAGGRDAGCGNAILVRGGDNVVVSFLGTGSAAPSKHRNTSAIHLQVNERGAGLMLDCGEGTLGQMKRLWGAEETLR